MKDKIREALLAARTVLTARANAGETSSAEMHLARLLVERHLAKLPPPVDTRHLAYVEADFESLRRGGSCRTATCLCGWKGPQRATLELAADDALMHERSGATLSG